MIKTRHFSLAYLLLNQWFTGSITVCFWIFVKQSPILPDQDPGLMCKPIFLQGSQRSGKTWKTWKKGFYQKKSGKTWKSQGVYVKFLKSQGKVRELLSRIPWNWWFLDDLEIPIFQNFLCRAQPWWALQMIMKLTKISTTDLFKTDGGISKNLKIISLNITNFGQGKKVYFHRDSGKNSPFSALLSGKKGRFLTKSQGKYFRGTAGNPVLVLTDAIGAPRI